MIKAIRLLFLATFLAACTASPAASVMSPTRASELTMSPVQPAVTKTQTAIITVPSLTPYPSASPLPVTETSAPLTENSLLPVSGTPMIVAMENGITWTECIAPSIDYAHSAPDYEFAVSCLNGEIPGWDEDDRQIAGERITGSNGSDLRQVIGNDVYMVKHDSTNGCCDYQLLKNGTVLLVRSAPLITFDPNRNLWNMDGKLVWELVTEPPTIIVDGIDLNEKHGLEGIFHPYAIRGKLLYIARQNGKYQVVYDEKSLGPEFDEIYIKYCCATTKVYYGAGRYWFWGKREGTYYVVAIQ